MKKHELPALSYAFDALEPYIDAKTVEIHYGKHHKGYVDKLNVALEKYPHLFDRKVEEILKDLNSVPADIRTTVKNNGGGHINHNLYWETMASSGKGGKAGGKILDAIKKAFGDFEKFKEQFSNAAAGHFASGWCWLVVNEDGEIEIMTTKDHESPVSFGKKPILVLDVWEHAYYLKYQNRRTEYIENWWNVVNWKRVEDNYLNAL